MNIEHDARLLAEQPISIACQSFNQQNEYEIELLKKALACFESEDLTAFDVEMERAVKACIRAAIRK